MYAYVTGELRAVVASRFPVRDDATGVFGHSMGGHGAAQVAGPAFVAQAGNRLRPPGLTGMVYPRRNASASRR